MEKIYKGFPSRVYAENLAALEGWRTELFGAVYKARRMSGFAFAVLKVGTGTVQCVFQAEPPPENSYVRVSGTVRAEPRCKTGYELDADGFEIISRAAEPPPVVINGKELSVSLDTLLDLRPLTLRNLKEQAVFAVQSAICSEIRRFLETHRFVEIHTPKLVSSGAEGGANVFELDYFGRKAYLAQSPQFYKQMMVAVFDRVYEIGPVFRAERHDTSRHTNEYTSVDAEMGFIGDFRELMRFETALLTSVFSAVFERCGEELALLGAKPPRMAPGGGGCIPSLTFEEAKRITNGEDDGDFSPEEEQRLGEYIAKTEGADLVFVTRYKTSKRPFYAAESEDDASVTDSFDLIFRGMEITTGGRRIHSYERQVEKLRGFGLSPEEFEGYLQAHRYGLPPHGGFGLGLERLTARLLGFSNIRRTTLFPRDTGRLTP